MKTLKILFVALMLLILVAVVLLIVASCKDLTILELLGIAKTNSDVVATSLVR